MKMLFLSHFLTTADEKFQNSYIWLLNSNLSLPEVYGTFITGMKETTWLEYIAVFSGIVSVWFSRKENI